MASSFQNKLESLIENNFEQTTSVSWKDLEFMNVFELRKKHIPVSPTVFIQISKDDHEYTLRKKAVNDYFSRPNVVFYADGTIGLGGCLMCSLLSPRPCPLPPPENN